MNIFDKINHWIESVESSLITLITTLIPWLSPALPAYFTYYHLSNMSIPVPSWVALSMAFAVEFLGLAAVSTAFDIMRHNKDSKNRRKSNKVPLGFPIGAYIFYIVVVLTVNVLMELPLPEYLHGYSEILAIALLTLISAPAFVIVISRNQRRQIDSDTDKPTAKNGSDNVSSVRDYDKMTVEEIMQAEGVSERTAYRRKASANGNGHSKEKVTV